MTMPDFIVMGAPKAGSTALHAALAGHPELFLSPVKEPKFFLCDNQPPPHQGGPGDAHSRQEWIWRREDYEDLFRDAPPGTLVGESTPLYLQDLDAHDRIARLAPDAKLIAVVRDPVDRAYSNWAHLWSDGLEPEADFLAACAAEDERQRRGWAPFWRYKGQGRYGEQLEHLYSVFPRDQVHVLRYRELVDEPQASIDAIATFLGVEPGLVGTVGSENVSTFVADTPVNARAAVGRAHRCPDRGLAAPAGRGAEPAPRCSGPSSGATPTGPSSPRNSGRHSWPSSSTTSTAWRRSPAESFDDWRGHRAGGTYSVRRA